MIGKTGLLLLQTIQFISQTIMIVGLMALCCFIRIRNNDEWFFPIQSHLIKKCAQNSLFFDKEDVFAFLVSVKKCDYDNSPSVPILEYPNAPSTWIYFASKDGDGSFVGDKYRWRDKSKVNTTATVFRRFYIAVKNKGNDSKGQKGLYSTEFQRHIYYLSSVIKQGDPIIIAYCGNHQVFEKFPHGNATVKTNFVSSTPLVKYEVNQRCNEIPSVDTLFNDIKADQQTELGKYHG